MKTFVVATIVLGLAIAAVGPAAGQANVTTAAKTNLTATAKAPATAAPGKCVSIEQYFKTTGNSLIVGVAMAELLKGKKVDKATLFIPSNSKLFEALPSVLPLLGKLSLADAVKDPKSVLAIKLFQDVLKQHIVLGANLDPTALPASAFKSNRATVNAPSLLTTDLAKGSLCRKGTTGGGVTVEVLGKSAADPAKKINILATGTAASLNKTLTDAPCGTTIHVINGVLLPCKAADFSTVPAKTTTNTTKTTTNTTGTRGVSTGTTTDTTTTSGTSSALPSSSSTNGTNTTTTRSAAVHLTGAIMSAVVGLLAAVAALL